MQRLLWNIFVFAGTVYLIVQHDWNPSWLLFALLLAA